MRNDFGVTDDIASCFSGWCVRDPLNIVKTRLRVLKSCPLSSGLIWRKSLLVLAFGFFQRRILFFIKDSA